MKSLFKKIWIETAVIFFLSLTPLLWFKNNAVIVGHDNIFGLNPIIFLVGRLSTWINHGFGQAQDLIMGTIPIHLIDAAPYFLGFSLQTTEKLVYIFWFLAIGISIYILAYTLNPRSLTFRLLTVVLYQFNFFLLQGWWIGERTKFSAYVALPLLLAVFIKVRRGELNVVRGAIFNSLIFFVFNAGGLYGIPLYGGLFVVILGYILFFSFINFVEKKYEVVKRLLLLTLFSLIGFILVNSYYLFPAINKFGSEYKSEVLSSGGVAGITEWANEISANSSFINIFRLQGVSEWYDNTDHPYAKYFLSNPILIVVSFLWPSLIFFSILKGKEKEKVTDTTYFFFIFLLGVFFTAGTHPPSGFLYTFFLKIVPGFISFRSPYFKFAPAVFLSSSILISYAVDKASGKWKKIAFCSLLIIIFAYHFPYFTGNFFTWKKDFSTRVNVPDYVFQFGNWLNKEKKDDGRILVLPPNNPDFQYSTYNWGYLSFQEVTTLLSNKSVVINNDRLSNQEKVLLSTLYVAFTRNDLPKIFKLAKLLRIRYVLLQKDAAWKIYLHSSYISLDPSFYEKHLTKNNFSLLKKFGEWEIYEIDQDTLPSIFLTNGLNVLDGSYTDIPSYISFSQNSESFFVRGDENIVKKIKLAQEMLSNYYLPECVNCSNKNIPVIKFPKRAILPDSPFYPLILFKEKIAERKISGKSKIYHDLGISLKRASEINQMVFEHKELTKTVMDRFDAVLKNITSNLNSLPNYEDKVQTAKDINYYMSAERDFLFPAFGFYITGGDSATIFARALDSIAVVEKAIDPFLFKLDVVNNRLYKLSLDSSGVFEMILGREELNRILRENSNVRIEIDGVITRDIKIDSNILSNEWLSFGKIRMEKGVHFIKLSFPEPNNIIGHFNKERVAFNIDSESSCFAAKINNFDNKNIYGVRVDYRNDFTDNLFLYIWEQTAKEKRLNSVNTLKSGITDGRFTRLLQANSDSRDVFLGLCARGLTLDTLNQKINARVTDYIQRPLIAFKPEQEKVNATQSVYAEKISPVKYKIRFTNTESNSALFFMEGFDKGWSMSEFQKNHFRADGYANAWMIDKLGTFDLVLEYNPQKIFYFGLFISVISVISCISYLFYVKFKKQQHDSR